jgi:hypothetical protein
MSPAQIEAYEEARGRIVNELVERTGELDLSFQHLSKIPDE